MEHFYQTVFNHLVLVIHTEKDRTEASSILNDLFSRIHSLFRRGYSVLPSRAFFQVT